MRTAAYSQCRTFADHTSNWVEPISTNYRGYDVYEIPPNGQGIAALLALNIAEGFDLQSMGHNSEAALHCLIEAMKLGFADLYQYITDPEVENVPVKGLLSTEYTNSQRARINLDRADTDPIAGAPPMGSDTVYLSAVDKDRNVVSFHQQPFLQAFGSGMVAGDTGIMLQNRGAGFLAQSEPCQPDCAA